SHPDLILIHAHSDRDLTEAFLFRNGVKGVEDQIENHLLELDSIACHQHPRGGSFKSERYIPQQRVAANHTHYFSHYLSDVERRFRHLALAKETAEPLDSLGSPQVILNDIAYRVPE